MQDIKFHKLSGGDHLSNAAVMAVNSRNPKEQKKAGTMEERLTALGMVATGIAHELNSPLATVKACAEGLYKRLEKGDYDLGLFKNYLKIIEEEINQCSIITGNILRSVQELEENNKENINIHDCLEKTINTVSLQGKCRNILIERDFDEKIPIISGNESGLRQVFLTIIINALDAMKEEGKLTLGTRIKKNSVVILINNSGPSIPRKHIEKIFHPYFTTKAKEGGTGLGLFLAKNIIKDCCGTIEVASDKTSGTTFTIVLPH